MNLQQKKKKNCPKAPAPEPMPSLTSTASGHTTVAQTHTALNPNIKAVTELPNSAEPTVAFVAGGCHRHFCLRRPASFQLNRYWPWMPCPVIHFGSKTAGFLHPPPTHTYTASLCCFFVSGVHKLKVFFKSIIIPFPRKFRFSPYI